MKKAMVIVAAMAVLAALISCQDSKGFEVRDGVLVKYLGASTKVRIPSTATSIGEGAFKGYTGITSVTIPSSVKSIGAMAFADCESLTSVILPTDVTLVDIRDEHDGAGSFDGDLVRVYNQNGKRAGTYVRNDGSWTKQDFWIRDGVLVSYTGTATEVTIPSGVTTIGENAFSGHIRLTSVTIPAGVTSIGEGAFLNCIRLTSISIPASVTSIAQDVVPNCVSLTSITVAPGNSVYKSIDGVLFDQAATILIKFPGGKGSYDIPAGVKSIGEGAFSASNIASISIPASVTSIGHYAFAQCNSLASVSIPSGVSLDITSFDGDLMRVYNANGKQAGTYVSDSGSWRKR